MFWGAKGGVFSIFSLGMSAVQIAPLPKDLTGVSKGNGNNSCRRGEVKVTVLGRIVANKHNNNARAAAAAAAISLNVKPVEDVELMRELMPRLFSMTACNCAPSC